MPKIYLDYAATTPIDPKVLKAMLPYLKKEFGNPSSIHSFGQKGLFALEKARKSVADFLGCSSQEIIFTGSATEADNLAIRGSVKSGHIITSQIEHPAVLEACKALERQEVKVTYLPVDKEGVVNPSDVQKAIRPDTVLVSIIYANNEIGTVQLIPEISGLVKKTNPKILFHTDAVQAANYLECDVNKLGVDLLTLSSHKIYGPKGVGAIYIKIGTALKPLIFGGGHDMG
ncbi:MAG: cysteine desulfurase family protein, partial [Candidatus Nealsonbacteria bacterium]|nr:cysteine desulfurase family protein [Candidatus Nealsonbacteria bacterium]